MCRARALDGALIMLRFERGRRVRSESEAHYPRFASAPCQARRTYSRRRGGRRARGASPPRGARRATQSVRNNCLGQRSECHPSEAVPRWGLLRVARAAPGARTARRRVETSGRRSDGRLSGLQPLKRRSCSAQLLRRGGRSFLPPENLGPKRPTPAKLLSACEPLPVRRGIRLAVEATFFPQPNEQRTCGGCAENLWLSSAPGSRCVASYESSAATPGLSGLWRERIAPGRPDRPWRHRSAVLPRRPGATGGDGDATVCIVGGGRRPHLPLSLWEAGAPGTSRPLRRVA
jgi:hypothetical protein